MKFFYLVMIPFLAVSFFPETALAHKATVFAWVEGDTVFTESKLSGGKRVVKGVIRVYDANKQLLLEGRTDDQGEFSFKVPETAPVLVELNAGMGHMARWTLNSEDLGKEAVFTEDSLKDEPKDNMPSPELKAVPPVPPEELEALIEKVMDEKLKPIKKMLAERHPENPSLTEILGGIGYIIGLVGMAAYFRYRKSGEKQD